MKDECGWNNRKEIAYETYKMCEKKEFDWVSGWVFDKTKEKVKDEWLKQWTISRPWVNETKNNGNDRRWKI